MSVSESFNEALLKIVPTPPKGNDKAIFKNYHPDVSEREDNWLNGFDFSGVGWDSTRAGTLIGERHILMAKHYQRAKGSNIIFHPRGQEPVIRTVIDTKPLQFTDVAIGLLDEPAHGCAVYPILPHGSWRELVGCYAFVTDQERKVLLYKISSMGDMCSIRGADAKTSPFYRETTISGDSGHPAFLPYGDNQLILLSAHWFGGHGVAGPNLANQKIQEAVIDAAERLSLRNS